MYLNPAARRRNQPLIFLSIPIKQTSHILSHINLQLHSIELLEQLDLLQQQQSLSKALKMIDHTGVWVPAAKHAQAIDFYIKALAPLGYEKRIAHANNQAVGFGDATAPADWWVNSTGLMGLPAESTPSPLPSHHAFKVTGQSMTLSNLNHLFRWVGVRNANSRST